MTDFDVAIIGGGIVAVASWPVNGEAGIADTLPPFFLKLTRMWERSSGVSKTKRICFSNPPRIHSEAKRCTVTTGPKTSRWTISSSWVTSATIVGLTKKPRSPSEP